MDQQVLRDGLGWVRRAGPRGEGLRPGGWGHLDSVSWGAVMTSVRLGFSVNEGTESYSAGSLQG